MVDRKRTKLYPAEKSDIWDRWKAGQSMHASERAFDRPHNTIHKLLLARGGIAPMARRRSRLALALAEREDISRGLASGSSLREIARGLSRATSTVSREIGRHGGRPSALRPKRCLLATRACPCRTRRAGSAPSVGSFALFACSAGPCFVKCSISSSVPRPGSSQPLYVVVWRLGAD